MKLILLSLLAATALADEPTLIGAAVMVRYEKIGTVMEVKDDAVRIQYVTVGREVDGETLFVLRKDWLAGRCGDCHS
jgi:hypothetical protein